VCRKQRWPGSVAEFLDIIGPLTDPRAHGGQPSDAFHVIAPSIPGFAFSGPTTATGWGVSRIAAAWAQLMSRLGYQRYGAQGGDFGSVISPELARLDTPHVASVHVNALTGTSPAGADGDSEGLTEREKTRLQNLKRWYTERAGLREIQSTRPQTLAYALADSPAGQLAWNAEWFEDYGLQVGTIDRDRILTNVMLYWLTDTAGSAAVCTEKQPAPGDNSASGPRYPPAWRFFLATRPSDASPNETIPSCTGRSSTEAATLRRCKPPTCWSKMYASSSVGSASAVGYSDL
jgi:pimeloyl-ACP methyl ester carboxylesterase